MRPLASPIPFPRQPIWEIPVAKRAIASHGDRLSRKRLLQCAKICCGLEPSLLLHRPIALKTGRLIPSYSALLHSGHERDVTTMNRGVSADVSKRKSLKSEPVSVAAGQTIFCNHFSISLENIKLWRVACKRSISSVWLV